MYSSFREAATKLKTSSTEEKDCDSENIFLINSGSLGGTPSNINDLSMFARSILNFRLVKFNISGVETMNGEELVKSIKEIFSEEDLFKKKLLHFEKQISMELTSKLSESLCSDLDRVNFKNENFQCIDSSKFIKLNIHLPATKIYRLDIGSNVISIRLLTAVYRDPTATRRLPIKLDIREFTIPNISSDKQLLDPHSNSEFLISGISHSPYTLYVDKDYVKTTKHMHPNITVKVNKGDITISNYSRLPVTVCGTGSITQHSSATIVTKSNRQTIFESKSTSAILINSLVMSTDQTTDISKDKEKDIIENRKDRIMALFSNAVAQFNPAASVREIRLSNESFNEIVKHHANVRNIVVQNSIFVKNIITDPLVEYKNSHLPDTVIHDRMISLPSKCLCVISNFNTNGGSIRTSFEIKGAMNNERNKILSTTGGEHIMMVYHDPEKPEHTLIQLISDDIQDLENLTRSLESGAKAWKCSSEVFMSIFGDKDEEARHKLEDGEAISLLVETSTPSAIESEESTIIVQKDAACYGFISKP